MEKRRVAAALVTVMAISLSACARNPDSSVVKSKNLDEMINKAGGTEIGSDYSNLVDEVNQNAQSYQKEITDESLGVTVHVDASVTVPETEKLSVFRVSQKKIGQEFLDKVRAELTPDVTYYDGVALSISSKALVAQQMQYFQRLIDEMETNNDYDEEAKQIYIEEYEEELSMLQEEYDAAPQKIDITEYPSDHKIHTVKEKYDSDPENTFYQWEYELNPNGEFYDGISDAKDGNYRSLFLQNNEDYGNCLRYKSSANGYIYTTSAAVENRILDEPAEGKDMPETTGQIEGTELEVKEYEGEETTISKEEAKSQADTLIEKLGLTEFKEAEGGLYFEGPDIRNKAVGEGVEDEGCWRYRKVYKFLYMRGIDGVFVDNSAGEKLVDEWSDDSYTKKLWSGESVIVSVNDSGIVGFEYNSPLSVDETIVEKSSVKSFEEIKEIFEQMVVVQNAVEEGSVSIDITGVKLVYARISEKDSFDTGILVPVWNFEGTIVDQFGYTTEGSVMSINAIDGSVIDWELGY